MYINKFQRLNTLLTKYSAVEVFLPSLMSQLTGMENLRNIFRSWLRVPMMSAMCLAEWHPRGVLIAVRIGAIAAPKRIPSASENCLDEV